MLALFVCCGVLATSSAQDDDDDIYIDRTPQKCIVVRNIDRTDVVDEQNILFYMRGGTIYRNYLPRACRSLAQQERFMYRTSIGRLCDVDWIEVLYSFGSSLDRGPSCGLGSFYEISEEEAELLKAGPGDIPKEPEKVDLHEEEAE
jgi:hypothetical protein